MKHWRNLHYRRWRWNMLVRSIMRPLHIHPWWDPEYDAHIAKERAEVAELLACLDEDAALAGEEKPTPGLDICRYPDWEGGLIEGKHVWGRDGTCCVCGEEK